MIAFTWHFLCRRGAAASARLTARGGEAQPMRDSVVAPGLACDGCCTRASPPQLQIFTTFSLRASVRAGCGCGASGGRLRRRSGTSGGWLRRGSGTGGGRLRGGCGYGWGPAAGRLRARRAVPIARTSFFAARPPPGDTEPNEVHPKSQFLPPLCDFGYISPAPQPKASFRPPKWHRKHARIAEMQSKSHSGSTRCNHSHKMHPIFVTLVAPR